MPSLSNASEADQACHSKNASGVIRESPPTVGVAMSPHTGRGIVEAVYWLVPQIEARIH